MEKLVYNPDLPSNFKEDHKFYGFNIGKVNQKQKLTNYTIEDPYIELLLKDAEFFFEDLHLCFQQKSLEIFFDRKYTTKELEYSIKMYAP